MRDIFKKITELEHLGEFEKTIVLVEEELKNKQNQERNFQLELVQLEANYNLRNFQHAKQRVEKLINQQKLEKYPVLLGDAHNLLGKIFRIHQRYEEALKHYQIAENAYKTARDNLGLTKIYINIGNVYIFLEEFKYAKKFHKKALDLAMSNENYDLIANCYLNLGSLHYQNGEVEDALSYYKEALKIFEDIDDIPALAAVHLNIAETLILRRNFIESAKYSATSIELYKQQRNTLGQNLALKSFARAERGAGNYENAIKSFEELLKLQDTSLNEDILLELGECHLELNNASSAEDIYQTLRNTPNYTPQSRGHALNYLATISGEKRDFNLSIKYYTELMEILRTLPVDDVDSRASTQGNLGYMHLKLEEEEKAFKNLDTALKHFRKRKIWEDAAILLNNFMVEFFIKKEYFKCVSFIEKFALPIAKKAKNNDWQTQLHSDIAFFTHLTGKSDEGVRYWKKFCPQDSLSQYKPFFVTLTDIPESERERLDGELRDFLKLISE
ncbi:MAG: tetratricopeptide repeat protein [Candidatus Hodarchaeales archaeon]|jgi:tetratricopeptide (TPR) repeat protein